MGKLFKWGLCFCTSSVKIKFRLIFSDFSTMRSACSRKEISSRSRLTGWTHSCQKKPKSSSLSGGKKWDYVCLSLPLSFSLPLSLSHTLSHPLSCPHYTEIKVSHVFMFCKLSRIQIFFKPVFAVHSTSLFSSNNDNNIQNLLSTHPIFINCPGHW